MNQWKPGQKRRAYWAAMVTNYIKEQKKLRGCDTYQQHQQYRLEAHRKYNLRLARQHEKMKREEAVKSFAEKKERTVGTLTSTGNGLLLHGNRIAEWRGNKVYATLAGWPTVTTRKWLNVLTDALYKKWMSNPRKRDVWHCSFSQCKHEQKFTRRVLTKGSPTFTPREGSGGIRWWDHWTTESTNLDNNEWVRIG